LAVDEDAVNIATRCWFTHGRLVFYPGGIGAGCAFEKVEGAGFSELLGASVNKL